MKNLNAILLIAYLGVLFVLLLAELGVPGFDRLRATDQVLLLLALFFLPLLLVASRTVIRSLTLKVSDKEFHVDLEQFRKDVKVELHQVTADVSGRLSTAEQALWPLLAGEDPGANARWSSLHLVIGSKEDLSQVFFAQLLAEQLERQITGLQCEVRVPNGGTLKNFADLKYHRIDVYTEFTGTGCQLFGIDHHGLGREALVEALDQRSRPLGLRWLKPLGATENYCIVMRRSEAERLQVARLGDLKRVSAELVFASDPEFLNRHDCYLGLVSTYALRFKRTEPCRITDRYTMYRSGEADLFVGYQTDPELSDPALVVLEDSECFFPPYDATPVVSAAALDRVDGLESALNQLGDVLTTEQLISKVLELRNRGGDLAIARELARQHLIQNKG